MNYSILFLPAAKKALAKLPKADQSRVDRHVLALADNPRPPGAIPLKGGGKGLWRVRVGDWRIIYQIEDDRLIVLVVDVANRREVYRGL
jgi:mRNA interferase RelE/StbE